MGSGIHFGQNSKKQNILSRISGARKVATLIANLAKTNYFVQQCVGVVAPATHGYELFN